MKKSTKECLTRTLSKHPEGRIRASAEEPAPKMSPFQFIELYPSKKVRHNKVRCRSAAGWA
jgi:hypothetical protein